jgi:hypothetical protein
LGKEDADVTALEKEGADATVVMQPLTTGRHAASRRPPAYLLVLAFVAVLGMGVGLRLWHLGISPAWQWDEAV